MFWKGIKLFLIVGCMLSIFLFSSDTADESNMKSDGIVVSIAEFFAQKTLNIQERRETIDKYVLFIRKGAHFSIFFVLGLLSISFLKEYHDITWKEMFYAFLFSFLYACSDEFHQLFVSGRSGNIIDVGIDSLGAYVGILFYYFYYQLRRKAYE